MGFSVPIPELTANDERGWGRKPALNAFGPAHRRHGFGQAPAGPVSQLQAGGLVGVSPCGSYLHVDTAADAIGGGRRVACHAVGPSTHPTSHNGGPAMQPSDQARRHRPVTPSANGVVEGPGPARAMLVRRGRDPPADDVSRMSVTAATPPPGRLGKR
jgi:hypothetical protein